MYEITVNLVNNRHIVYRGNFIIEGSFVRINYDHDENKKTPQRTIVYPAHLIESIDCEVIQSGVR